MSMPGRLLSYQPEAVQLAVLDALASPGSDLSQSPYDIAIVSLGKGPFHPECIRWLTENRNADGTWGAEPTVSWFDKYICTYAAAAALRNAGLVPQADAALAVLPGIVPPGRDEALETLTFGGLVAALDRYCQARQWPATDHPPRVKQVVDDEQRKWSAVLKWSEFYNPAFSIAGYCGERVFGDPSVEVDRFAECFQVENGSISSSPAASTLVLLEVERRGAPVHAHRLARLREYVHGLTPYRQPIGYLDHVPFFVLAWSLIFTSELGLPCQSEHPAIRGRIADMQAAVFGQGGFRLISSLPSTIPGDTDDTSCALLALDYAGASAALQDERQFDSLYVAEKGCYQTFHFERQHSLSTNIHMAALLARWRSSKLPAVLRWLEAEIIQTNNNICKWHASPFYTMGELARVMARVEHPTATRLALHAASYLLKSQRDGGWGHLHPSVEETGYAVLGLAAVLERLATSHEPEAQDLSEQLRRALSAAQPVLEDSSNEPLLWIGKSLYQVRPFGRILRAVGLGRIHQSLAPSR